MLTSKSLNFNPLNLKLRKFETRRYIVTLLFSVMLETAITKSKV